MPNLLSLIRAKQLEVRAACRMNPDGIAQALLLLGEIQADLDTTGDSLAARERLETLLLELPQTQRCFRVLAEGCVKLNPDDQPTLAEVAEAIHIVLNTFLQARPGSAEEIAFALLTAVPTAPVAEAKEKT